MTIKVQGTAPSVDVPSVADLDAERKRINELIARADATDFTLADLEARLAAVEQQLESGTEPEPEPTPETGQWSTEVNGVVYGATADAMGPIGGGEGYTRIVTEADAQVVVRTKAELDKAIFDVPVGGVVFVPGDVEMDLGEDYIWIDKTIILASDRGHNGSLGALLFTDLESGMNRKIFHAADGIRITGFRMRGPNGTRDGSTAFRSIFIQSNRSDGETDNCEIWNCVHAGISYASITNSAGDGGHQFNNSAHHNYIHHCWAKGLGYGVVMGQSDTVVHHNRIDATRHAIAHSGDFPSFYAAHDNVVGPLTTDHCLDMHEDGTTGECGVVILENNTVIHPEPRDVLQAEAVDVRAVPYEPGANIERNWFWWDASFFDRIATHIVELDGSGATYGLNGSGVDVGANLYGELEQQVIVGQG